MSIDLSEHMLNDRSALVLHGERELEDADLAQLHRLSVEQRSKLTVVVLSRTRVTGACLKHLACLPNLRTLYLNATQINDEDWFDVSGWALESINLDNTRIGDQGIARLQAATRLEVVRLCNTRVSDTGIQLLGTFPRLREYCLCGAPISDHAKRRLDNTIKMGHLDITEAVRSVRRHLAFGVRKLISPGTGWSEGECAMSHVGRLLRPSAVT